MSNKTNQSVLVNDTSSYYLKQYAALQFPGSVLSPETTRLLSGIRDTVRRLAKAM